MRVGFTGTQGGMNSVQAKNVNFILNLVRDNLEFFHGDCVGADNQAYNFATALSAYTTARPCTILSKRAFTQSCRVHEPVAPLERNHIIVDEAELMIATPKENEEVLRSGTWATIRYAKKTKTPLIVFLPNGKKKVFDHNDFVANTLRDN